MNTTPAFEAVNYSHRPWHVRTVPDNFAEVCDTTGSIVATVNLAPAEGLGNAALIAAAPDLLAALKAFVTLYFAVVPVLDAHELESEGRRTEQDLPFAVMLAHDTLRRLDSFQFTQPVFEDRGDQR